MHVYCSHEEGGKIGDPTGPEVRFAHLKSAVLAAADPQMITEAKDLIMSCNNPLKKGKSVIPGALLRSICLLYTAYPKLRPGQECGDEFEEFFIGAVGNKLPERYGTNVERDCRSGFPKTYRMAAGIAQEIVDHQKDHPGTFKAVSKGAYNRVQKADLKRLAKARTKTQKRGKK
jgi:hypothetical protein